MGDTHNTQDHPRFHTNLSVGEILRRTRAYHNLSLEQVSADLRIRTAQLDAIERSAYEELPGRVYAIGFIRNYAEYLDLDGEKIIHLFKTQAGGRQTEPELDFPVPASESRMPDYKALSAAALLLIGLSIAWFWLTRDNSSASMLSIPEVPASLEKKVSKAKEKGKLDVSKGDDKVSPSPGKSASRPETHQNTEAGQDKNGNIILKATAEVWVEIRNERDEVILSEILTAGDRYSLPDSEKEKFVMATGNAGGLEIVVDGRTLESLGAQGEVKRGIALEEEALKAFSTHQ